MDSLKGMFGGGAGAPAADLPPIGAPAADISGQIFLPPGGSVETSPGGVAPTEIGSIPAADASAGGPAGGAGNLLKMIPAAGGLAMSLKNMFTTSPTEAALEKGQKLQMRNATAASRAGKTQLSQYQQGLLSPSQQASIDQFRNAELAKWRQYFASAGIPEGTGMLMAENDVAIKTDAYKNQLLQNNMENSVKLLGLGGNTLAQAANANIQQEQMIAQSQAAAMKAIAELFGAMG